MDEAIKRSVLSHDQVVDAMNELDYRHGVKPNTLFSFLGGGLK